MGDSGQRTEQPTQRRVDKAREQGRFPTSREFVGAAQFLTIVILLGQFGGDWLLQLKGTTSVALRSAFSPGDLTPARLQIGLQTMAVKSLAPLMAAGALLMVVMLGVHGSVTRLGFAPQKLAPDFKRLNPLPRLLDLPRQNLTQLGQAAILFPVFAWTVWALAEANLPLFMSLVRMGVGPGLVVISGSVQSLLWKAAALFAILGVVDLFRQKRRYRKDLRMSKQEIREEYKEVEGNPQVKAHIRRLMRSLLRRRMMSEVPKATAVIVNPTHYAVAIRYQMESMAAPRVVAKGKNYLARRIRQIALDNEIPIVENPPLAQSLYKAVEVGQEIPAHLYRAVAEVLAYIYRLMHMRPVAR